jgi:hypothetical protein
MANPYGGRVLERGGDGYEQARRAAVWNARTMELMVFIHRTEEGELEIAVTGPVLADSDEQAREAVAVLQSCPVLDRAKLALPYVPGELADLYAGAHAAARSLDARHGRSRVIARRSTPT